MYCPRQVPNAAAGLAFEAEMFAARDARVGIWSSKARALVCPKAYERRNGVLLAVKKSKMRGWPVFRRPTGGGVVPQGPEVMNIALAFNAPKEFTIEDGYCLITEVISSGLDNDGVCLETGETPGSFCDGVWNLSVNGRKLAGAAQRWRQFPGERPRILIHALILVRGDIRACAEAVSAFQTDLGLEPIAVGVHTSTEIEFGLTKLPYAALLATAEQVLRSIRTASA